MTINPVRVGAAFGAILGLWHLAWSVVVAFGAAQAVIDFVLWIHFIDVPVQIAPFSASLAGLLVIVTSTIGFILGLAFALIWNWFQEPDQAKGHRKRHQPLKA